MSQSSPEGIILGKGSVLKSLDLSINKEKVLSITQEQDKNKFSEEEVRNLIEDWTKMEKGLNINFPLDKFNEWFEQFKKK
jgi:hypothetical protein